MTLKDGHLPTSRWFFTPDHVWMSAAELQLAKPTCPHNRRLEIHDCHNHAGAGTGVAFVYQQHHDSLEQTCFVLWGRTKVFRIACCKYDIACPFRSCLVGLVNDGIPLLRTTQIVGD